jgi:hypothetical protein
MSVAAARESESELMQTDAKGMAKKMTMGKQ